MSEAGQKLLPACTRTQSKAKEKKKWRAFQVTGGGGDYIIINLEKE